MCLSLGKRGTEVCGLSEVLILQWRASSRESSGFGLHWAYPSTEERQGWMSGPRTWALCRAQESLCAPIPGALDETKDETKVVRCSLGTHVESLQKADFTF